MTIAIRSEYEAGSEAETWDIPEFYRFAGYYDGNHVGHFDFTTLPEETSDGRWYKDRCFAEWDGDYHTTADWTCYYRYSDGSTGTVRYYKAPAVRYGPWLYASEFKKPKTYKKEWLIK